jgi:hypothetical protein
MGKTTKGSFTRTVLQVQNRIEKSHSSTLPRPRPRKNASGSNAFSRAEERGQIAKTHCKKRIAKTHFQIFRVNEFQPVIIETLIGLIKAKCFLIMACRWKM